MKRNLTYILGVLFLMTSCIQVNFDDVAVNPGDEVSFSAALYRSATKTVYGAEANNKVPVYWVNNDTITVYGAKCVEGRKQANYTISTVNSDGTVGTNMDYALSINRVGAYGVQWGSEASNFYAIYPAAKGEFGTDGNSNVTVTTTVREGQKNMFKKVNNVWVGTPYVEDKNNPTMRDALMYAYTPATATSASKSVDLKFHPFTTVLKFKLEGFDGHVFDNTGLKAYVTKIVVTAPDNINIAGDCTFTFTNGQPTASNGTSNKITIYPDYLPLDRNDDVEFYVFAIPYEGMQISEDWSVTVETSNLGTFTYRITPSTSNNNSNKKADLTPGKIHKITVPEKTIALKNEVTLPPKNWVEFIPRNVYLSELSIPGAWCCYPYSNGDVGSSEQYQQNATIAAQYTAGVRAFHIDCRITNGELVVAGTEEAPQGYANASVESAIRSIAAQLTNKKEYVVVVLSVAEKAYKSNSSVNPSDVLSAINDMVYTLADGTDDPIDIYKGDIVYTKKVNDKTYNIYKGVDANTTVNDVAGKIIIKINANTTTLGSFFGPALISEASLATSSNTSNGIVEGSFDSMNSSQMFWGAESAGLTFYYHHGQGTGLSGQPTMNERKNALKNIVQMSDKVYNSGKHNAWFQMGIGGFMKTGGIQIGSSYIGGSDKPSEVAKQLNPEVLNLITSKLNGQNDTSPSPVGIVLMNFSTQTSDTYKSDDLIDAIIRMNNAFILNRNPEFEEWPDGVNPYDALFGTSGASATSMYATIEPLN